MDNYLVTGLSSGEAEGRLKQYGRNALPEQKSKSIFSLIIDALKEPMFALLAACTVIYFLIGSHDEAAMLFCFVFGVVGMTVMQERRTEKALDSLKMLAPRIATVVRDGEAKQIPSEELVPGDVVVLAEGDAVPADCVVASCNGLLVDESLVTGESAPVHKAEKADVFPFMIPAENSTKHVHDPAQNSEHVFSGTIVVGGKGVCVVEFTGEKTQIGVIGQSLAELGDDSTPLEDEIESLVGKMAIIAACACVVVFIGNMFITRNWLKSLLSALSLAMGLLPEEFPVVLSVFVTIGALRMSWMNVLVKKNKAVETLSCCSVVCTDKTGTLTTNGMIVHTIISSRDDGLVIGGRVGMDIPDEFANVLEWGALAGLHARDAMHMALVELFHDGVMPQERSHGLHDGWQCVREYPFNRVDGMSTCVWDNPNDARSYVVSSKGSPESILRACKLPGDMYRHFAQTATELSNSGLRVIAVSSATFPKGMLLPETQSGFQRSFLGMIAYLNPLRGDAPEVVAQLQQAGIRVIMITGDSPGTASCIANSCGITQNSFLSFETPGSHIVTGTQIEDNGEEWLNEAIASADVFSRVLPQHKLSIVQALKNKGDIVCMVGDGVNDAPALKASHVGVAMGRRGTAVAREAADLVLLDDSLASLVSGVRMGRRIRDNIIKAVGFVIAVHIPLCGMVLIPVLLGWPTIFFPSHIVCMELIIDPACSIVLEAEPEEEDVMKRPPSKTQDHLVTKKSFIMSAMQGFVVLIHALVWNHIVRHTMHLDMPDASPEEILETIELKANACTFVTIITASLGLVFINRSWTLPFYGTIKRKNTSLWIMTLLVFLIMIVAVTAKPLQPVFHFRRICVSHFVMSVLVGIMSVAWFEIKKHRKYRKAHPSFMRNLGIRGLFDTTEHYDAAATHGRGRTWTAMPLSAVPADAGDFV